MTSVAGIVEYIARTEGPDTSAAVGADIENGRLDETLAGFGSSCRLYSYKLGGVWQTYIRGIVPKAPLSLGESQPALEAIAIPVAQFKDPVADVGPFLVKPHTKGKGKRTRNSAPAFLPPQPPATAPQQRPGQQRIDEMLPRQGTSASPASADGPSPVPGPGAVLSAIQGFGAQQEAERQALAARLAREAEERRQGRRAQRLQHTLAFRAELEAGFRAGQISGAEASERWRAFEAETAGLSKGLGYSYRRVAVPQSYARRALRLRSLLTRNSSCTMSPCQSLVRALLRHIDRHDAHWALVREAHALLLGLPNDEPDRERLSCSSACFAIFSCSSIALAGVSAMIMARERPVAGAMRVVQEPQARPDLLRRLCQVQAGGLEGAARGEPSQSSSTLCSESHVMTTHLHSSWRKPHLPCDPFELSASMRRLRSREKARRQVTRITRQPPARAGSR
eukprot:tig00000194_g14739.t1